MFRAAVSFVLIFMSLSSLSAQSSKGNYFAFRLGPHEDLRQGILRVAQEHKLKAAAIVTCVGSLEATNLRYANRNDGQRSPGHFEIVSLTGTVSDESSHLHLSVSDSTGRTTGGHLLDGNLIYTTAEIVLVELSGLEFEREVDSTYGYRELKITKRRKHDQ